MLVIPQRIQKSNTARNEINKANYFANRLAFVFKNQKRELLTGIAPTVDSTSIVNNELVCANAAANLYFNKNFVQTTAASGDGSYTWLIVAKIAAADGTVSNLVGQKNDLSGAPYSQGLLLAHANSTGGYSANSIVLYEFSGATSSSVASTVAVNPNKYQTIIGSRIGGTQYICVDGVVNSATTTAVKTTPTTERTVIGNSGKATNDDAGAFNSLLACGWNRGFSPAELIALSQNPWQIFQPDSTSIYFNFAAAGIDLAANAQSISTATGYIAQSTALSASAISEATAAGQITQSTSLSANAILEATATGQITQSTSLSANASGVATATGDVSTGVPGTALAGSATASATATGALSQATALTGGASAIVTASGTVNDLTPKLAGNAVSTATASATFFSELKRVTSYRYAPGVVPEDLPSLVKFLQLELYNIKSGLDSVADGHLDKSYTAPYKPSDGDIRYADGSYWNPGSGPGIYRYNGSAWVFLG